MPLASPPDDSRSSKAKPEPLMVRRAAFSLDNKLPEATQHCAMAKRFATDAGFEVANQALQLHGGYGYPEGLSAGADRA
jgi:alkylation response protein AidB-like acyl-CoA dehydrogenase